MKSLKRESRKDGGDMTYWILDKITLVAVL